MRLGILPCEDFMAQASFHSLNVEYAQNVGHY